jgi:hypothetical protein
VTSRDRILIAVAASLAVLAAFWFVALGPKRAEATKVEADVAVQQARLQTAQAAAATAGEAKRNYRADYATVAGLGKAVPADDDMPSLLVQLDAAASGAKVDFSSISLAGAGAAASAAPALPASAAAAATANGNSPSTPASATPASSTAAPAATAQTATAALPPGATVGTAGLATMPFTFVFDGSFFDLQSFLARVQGFVRPTGSDVAVKGRLLTVDGIALVPGEQGLKRIKATLAATGYLLPEDQGLANGASATSPAGAQAAAGTSSSPTQTAVTPTGATR